MTPRLICLAALLAAAPAFAATPIDQTRPLSPTGTVSVENTKGRIVVRTWNRPEVKITGSLGEGVEKLLVQGDSGHLRIEVRNPKRSGGWFGWGGDARAGSSIVEVTLPVGATVSVESVSADIDVAGTGGSKLSVESVSGDVLVRSSRAGVARFETVSGDLDLEIDSGDLAIDSVSGDMLVKGRIRGRVRLDTVSGDATLVAGALDSLSLSTVSGDGELTAGLAGSGSITADSVSGGLTLILPADISARLRVETFSGDITSPVGNVRAEKFGPGKHLDARLGAGAGDIRLESFSGDVRITVK